LFRAWAPPPEPPSWGGPHRGPSGAVPPPPAQQRHRDFHPPLLAWGRPPPHPPPPPPPPPPTPSVPVPPPPISLPFATFGGGAFRGCWTRPWQVPGAATPPVCFPPWGGFAFPPPLSFCSCPPQHPPSGKHLEFSDFYTFRGGPNPGFFLEWLGPPQGAWVFFWPAFDRGRFFPSGLLDNFFASRFTLFSPTGGPCTPGPSHGGDGGSSPPRGTPPGSPGGGSPCVAFFVSVAPPLCNTPSPLAGAATRLVVPRLPSPRSLLGPQPPPGF